MRLFFKGLPGETVSETVTVANTTSEPYEFLVNLQDWNRDSTGAKHYFPAGSLPLSNARTINLQQTSFAVAPGEKKLFTVSMQIPKTDTQRIATNSMLFFTQTNARRATPAGKSGIGLTISMEFGIQLFYTPGAAEKGGLAFLAFHYEPRHVKDSIGHRLAVRYRNTGAVNKDGQIRFELTNKQTGEEIKPDPVPLAIMPLSDQVVYCPLKNVAKGDYLAVVILDTQSDEDLKVAEKHIHVEE